VAGRPSDPINAVASRLVWRRGIWCTPCSARFVHARGDAEPLLVTLEAYLDTGGVATESAKRLHVSVRTVTYRPERIEKPFRLQPRPTPPTGSACRRRCSVPRPSTGPSSNFPPPTEPVFQAQHRQRHPVDWGQETNPRELLAPICSGPSGGPTGAASPSDDHLGGGVPRLNCRPSRPAAWLKRPRPHGGDKALGVGCGREQDAAWRSVGRASGHGQVRWSRRASRLVAVN
jgi:hypothetical protein